MSSQLVRGMIPRALVCLVFSPLAISVALGQTVIATIPVQGFPGQGSTDPIAQKAYIPTGAGTNGIAQVTVIDEKTNKISGIITLPTDFPATTAVLNTSGSRLYVGTEFGGLYVADTKTFATVGFVNVNAVSMAFNPLSNKLYVSDFSSGLYVVDTATLNILKFIPINGIENVSLNPFTNRVYAAQEYFPGQVSVVDGSTDTVIATPQAANGLSFATAVDPGHNIFYSTDLVGGSLSVYDSKTNTRTAAVSLPGQPVYATVDPFTRTIYVTNQSTNELDIINGATNTLTRTVPVAAGPEYSSADPFHKLVYVGSNSTDANGNPTNTVTVVKTR